MVADARDRFLAAADGLGVRVEPVTYPAGTRTAQDAAAAIGCLVDQIVKSLVFVAIDEDGGERPILALTSGARRVDTARLAEVAGAARVRKADADEVRAATGFAIGGTPPFGHVTDLPVYLDPHLDEFERIWAAAGTPQDVFELAPDDLVRAGAQREGDFTTD